MGCSHGGNDHAFCFCCVSLEAERAAMAARGRLLESLGFETDLEETALACALPKATAGVNAACETVTRESNSSWHQRGIFTKAQVQDSLATRRGDTYERVCGRTRGSEIVWL